MLAKPSSFQISQVPMNAFYWFRFRVGGFTNKNFISMLLPTFDYIGLYFGQFYFLKRFK